MFRSKTPLLLCLLFYYTIIGNSLVPHDNPFDDIFRGCELDPTGFTYCIGFMEGSNEIVLCRNDHTTCERRKIVLRVQITLGDPKINITLVGAYRYGWVAVGLSKRYDRVMHSGSPVIFTISEDQFHNTFTGNLGRPEGEKYLPEILSPALFGLCPNAILKEHWTIINCLIDTSYIFNILNSQDKTSINEPHHILLAQGHLKYPNDEPFPRKHFPDDNGKSRYKFTLSEPFGGVEARIYQQCGRTAYCFGIGVDGCGRASFDCDVFVKIRKKRTEKATFLLQGKFNGTIALGISESPRLDLKEKWKHLKYLLECKPGTGAMTEYKVSGCNKKKYGSCHIELNTNPNISLIPIAVEATENFPPTTHPEWTQCAFEIEHSELVKLGFYGEPHNLFLMGRYLKGPEPFSLTNHQLPTNKIQIFSEEISNFTSVYVNYLPSGITSETVEWFAWENFLVQYIESPKGPDPFLLNPLKPSQAHNMDYYIIYELILLGLGTFLILFRFLQ